jgi:hypothetical protein
MAGRGQFTSGKECKEYRLIQPGRAGWVISEDTVGVLVFG